MIVLFLLYSRCIDCVLVLQIDCNPFCLEEKNQ